MKFTIKRLYVSHYITGKSRELLNGNVGTNEWKELSMSLGQSGDQKSCEKHFVANISPFSWLGWLRGVPKGMVCDEVNSNWKDHAMYNARTCQTSRSVLQGCWKLWQPGKIMFGNEESLKIIKLNGSDNNKWVSICF